MGTYSSPRATPREGIALPIALAAIVAVGALIAGVVFASTQEYRVGRNMMAAQTALHGAEVGLNSVVASWTPARTNRLKVGFRDSLRDTVIDGAFVKREWARVSPTMFWVTCTAVAGGLGLQQRALKRLNTLVRVDIPDLPIQGALTVRGNISATGTGTISGVDMTPRGWDDCDDAGTTQAGIVVGSTANATSSGQCGNGNTFTCVTGSPQVAASPIYADTMTYKNFDGFTYDSLAKLASADKIYTPGLLGTTIAQRAPQFNLLDGSCNRTHPNNWGDTSRVNGLPGCRDYFPVILLKDRTVMWTVNNYGGQGILLVEGDLKIAGSFQWTGLIIVQGHIEVAGNLTPKVYGAIMAMNRDNETNLFSGTPHIQFSRCAVQAVTARLATARQTKYRSWADMSF